VHAGICAGGSPSPQGEGLSLPRLLDLDIRSFFDSVPHDLLLKAVAHHTQERWVLLYIERWLNAPMRMPDGTLVARERGTPQGSPISSLLANLFMNYAFDWWMVRAHPGCPFERYADDIVVHCDTEVQARRLWVDIAVRLKALGLGLHPEKTKVVYCKDTNRSGNAEHTSFEYLGYTFRGREASGPRGYFVSFAPGISPMAKSAISHTIRDWHLRRRSESDLSSIAAEINPQVRGWIGYYGVFYRSELHFLKYRIDQHIVRWMRHKFKRLRYSPVRAWALLAAVKQREPGLFVHWQSAPPSPKGRPARAV
jgi:RNA-directed DNA polymerase